MPCELLTEVSGLVDTSHYSPLPSVGVCVSRILMLGQSCAIAFTH